VGKAVESGGLSLDQARVFSDLPERLSEQLSRDEVTLVNTVAHTPPTPRPIALIGPVGLIP